MMNLFLPESLIRSGASRKIITLTAMRVINVERTGIFQKGIQKAYERLFKLVFSAYFSLFFFSFRQIRE